MENHQKIAMEFQEEASRELNTEDISRISEND
jgi:hypothetical protein